MRVELEMGDMNKIKNSNIKTIIRKVLASFRYLLKFIGPAFIVSVAYVDPGNFATNISGGSMFNYDLIWVILWSNIMAIFLQINSAKLGIATDNNLPQMCRKVFSKNSTGSSGLLPSLLQWQQQLQNSWEVQWGYIFYLIFLSPLQESLPQ